MVSLLKHGVFPSIKKVAIPAENRKMLKHKSRWPHSQPYETVWMKPKPDPRSVPLRRGLVLRRAVKAPCLGRNRPNQRPSDLCSNKITKSKAPTFVIQSQEIAAFFSLFDDRLIRDFLLKDSCCKITDKYLLAMTFVYFKRAHFAVSDYTRKNFFLALYLANTMEEDEEESKYEIFPWTLGKNWRKKISSFLKQRDALWARMEYRAAVSSDCCKKVMAITPSHSLWQRERLKHHSGAQRYYDDHPVPVPRGPAASPVHCALCNCEPLSDKASGSSFFPDTFKENRIPVFLHRFTTTMALKKTLTRAARHPSCCSAEVLPTGDSSSGTTDDAALNWIFEE
ncbi:speedy protein A isoform X3 [Takifugu rubripes]|uniref:speedy protein A isoform X3 n=1 Tax=Takifugu rubripes TaxID=31033 RepID=UPI0011460C33|nr:speedy protein A isoform X3 [Takifugu rubripes]